MPHLFFACSSKVGQIKENENMHKRIREMIFKASSRRSSNYSCFPDFPKRGSLFSSAIFYEITDTHAIIAIVIFFVGGEVGVGSWGGGAVCGREE